MHAYLLFYSIFTSSLLCSVYFLKKGRLTPILITILSRRCKSYDDQMLHRITWQHLSSLPGYVRNGQNIARSYNRSHTGNC